MNKSTLLALVVVGCAVASPAVAQDRPVAGRIKVSSGEAYVLRDGAQTPAQLGQVVYESDGLRTGAAGKIGVTLNDDKIHVRSRRQQLQPGAEIHQGRVDLRVRPHREDGAERHAS